MPAAWMRAAPFRPGAGRPDAVPSAPPPEHVDVPAGGRADVRLGALVAAPLPAAAVAGERDRGGGSGA